MTEYSNPQIPEGINVSSEHPLKEFAAMVLGVGLIILVIILLLAYAAQYAVRYVPFSVEQNLTKNIEQWDINKAFESDAHTLDKTHKQAMESYLQSLADQLIASRKAPYPVVVHYIDSDQVNAFATLGGHLFFTRALLEKMPNENTLAMVMAHEIAHVSHRDPMVALGRGLTLAIAAASILGAGDGVLAQNLVGQVNLLTQLNFSRSAEMDADQEALHTLMAHYGHLYGADTLFKLLRESRDGEEPFEWFSTHPLTEDRLLAIKQFSAQHLSSQKNPKPTPLPILVRELNATK
ncbi:M48 family metallopeptidase [Simiduia curdlanivorans]|uniref:M48 family metallopeptidase n=1 Tax=Simiduia curdlanivorans TaxID=1492769 RepID=A0ABV8V592_9GAMM|nr:M48 family metallopeptidase [Simiduia curdlanivorans]MDN3640719.1 M48 family metallopeptidase [Simiduia curdlanivorans]